MKIIYVFIFCSWLSALAQFNSTQPNENTPVKFIKVLVHFINYEDGLRSFSQENGKLAAIHNIKLANLQLANLRPISLKFNGQQLPSLPTKYRYVISPKLDDPDDPESDGIYFHIYSKSHLPRSLKHEETRTIFSKFVKHKDVINIFFVDGYQGNGIANTIGRKDLKQLLICTVGSNANNPFDTRGDGLAHGINHEIGHLLGRNHTWGEHNCENIIVNSSFDDCNDTPPNHNCSKLNWYSKEDSINCPSNYLTFCDLPEKLTNNVMDYGQDPNNVAFTPCQLGGIHSFLDFRNDIITTNTKKCNSSENILITNNEISNNLLANSIYINGNSSVSFINKDYVLFEAKSILLKSGFNVKSTQRNQTFIAKTNQSSCPSWELNTDESTWDAKHKDYFGFKNNNYNQRQEFNGMRGISCGIELNLINTNIGSNLRTNNEEEIYIDKNQDKAIVKDLIKFSITPNPSFGECTINNLSSVAYEIEVFNTSGILVYKESHANGNSKINLQQSGVFIVKIFAENQVFIHKIINYESD